MTLPLSWLRAIGRQWEMIIFVFLCVLTLFVAVGLPIILDLLWSHG
jgi:hypothetical protein